jgi:hypothetical protein
MTSIFFILAVSLLPAAVLLLVSRRYRVSSPSCPACGHDASMLSVARCTECGTDLSGGVVAVGGLLRSTTRWLALLWVVYALVAGLLVSQVVRLSMPQVLANFGILQVEDLEVETISVVLNPDGPRIDIACSKPTDRADGREITVRVVPTNQLISGFILSSAEWWGPAEADDDPASMVPGYRFETEAMLESLRVQLSGDESNALGMILADPENTEQLQRAIDYFTGPRIAAFSRGWIAGDGTELFTGTISHQSGIDVRVHAAGWWWVMPQLVVGVLVLLAILVGVNIFRFRRTLVPWSAAGDRASSP